MNKATGTSKNSKSQLLNAAKAVMEESGYATVTSRRVAAKAGLKPQLVHYYFSSMDDLLLELFSQLAKEFIELQEDALNSERPLRNLWKLLSDPKRRLLLEQFRIMSRYDDNLQGKLGEFGNIYRKRQIDFMEKIIIENNLDRFPFSPEFISIAFNAIARVISIEPTYGLNLGIREALDTINYYIDLYDKEMPDLETTIKRLEQENASLKATIADLVKKIEGSTGLS